ncbi:hypothetical protein EV11_1156 [Prochlorococcus sp. SS52]|nr:hypothetical protein EV04_0571 [Prochlorococcus marinus str. LG]KGG20746.1 hypothetical protein EV08_0950 [Prochlorococcus marinus str. SS2]KGG25147.1 hypothetical protein EV09_0041 [Prochlorococcus marinus str. SS35]KGG33301.1 hypothetical protein EV10_0508 [Prochlorococcus marinus str. SS51]KGG35592.1 hypothetical protein EV11_1156 [Prochlorococcus sp. SS52]
MIYQAFVAFCLQVFPVNEICLFLCRRKVAMGFFHVTNTSTQ